MEDMGVAGTFDNVLHVPLLQEGEVVNVLNTQHAFSHGEVSDFWPLPQLLHFVSARTRS